MNVTAMGEAGLTGWRRQVGERVAGAVARRTKLSEEQVRALIGAVFLTLITLQYLRILMRVLNAGRQRSSS
jgi:hypothetical protein